MEPTSPELINYNGLTFHTMIMGALAHAGDCQRIVRDGMTRKVINKGYMSRPAVRKYILANYDISEEIVKEQLTPSLKAMFEKYQINQLRQSFKIGDPNRLEAAQIREAKRAEKDKMLKEAREIKKLEKAEKAKTVKEAAGQVEGTPKVKKVRKAKKTKKLQVDEFEILSHQPVITV